MGIGPIEVGEHGELEMVEPRWRVPRSVLHHDPLEEVMAPGSRVRTEAIASIVANVEEHVAQGMESVPQVHDVQAISLQVEEAHPWM